MAWSCLVLAFCLTACAAPEAPAPAPLPEGGGLPPDVEAMIFGSATPCVHDASCPSGICSYGSCIGVLLAEQRWMHARATSRLTARVSKRPELRARVLDQLTRVAHNTKADAAYRSRSVRSLEALDAPKAIEALLADPSARLADEAALCLARMGHSAGLEAVQSLAVDEQAAVAVEALRALGHVPGDPALRTLLAALNPDLDGPVIRAAIDGLQTLGDPRAIRPLVATLTLVPGHLKHRVVRALRKLSGARLGGEAQGWSRWMEEHNPPAAPEVALRTPPSHEEEGLPAPY